MLKWFRDVVNGLWGVVRALDAISTEMKGLSVSMGLLSGRVEILERDVALLCGQIDVIKPVLAALSDKS